MKIGQEAILTSSIDGVKITIAFASAEWRTEIEGQDFNTAKEECETKFSKGQPPSKGVDKGKPSKH